MKHGTRVAIDVGGTFTDIVSLDPSVGSLSFDKVPTTPDDPQRGVMNGFAATGIDLTEIEGFIHGTTLGLNALLTRGGARTGIVTTKGFRDVYLLGRTDRTPMYDVKYRKPTSLVERAHIVEVEERLDFQGNALTPFDEESARTAARRVVELGLESVAVCFLHSYIDPSHEQRMAEILAEEAPSVEVTVSSDLSRELREYERTSTAVLDAYIKPIVRRYLAKLRSTLTESGFDGQFLVTRSGGGALTATAAQEAPVHLILSGPAGGVLGAAWFAEVGGYDNLITVDMGGTSLDASLVVGGQPVTHHDASFEGLPINLASLYIHTIGAGGGSLVHIDDGGHLQVGPASAGADPGPAAYGQGGTEATFTDAALHIGYLGNDVALAGTLSLDKELAERALHPSALALGMSIDDVARGVVKISVTKIVGAVRAITVEQGHNPSDFALLTFGGGGGLVAVDVARELRIPSVIVPPGPGAFCALGMLMADVQHDFARTRIAVLDEVDPAAVQQEAEAMREEGEAALSEDGFFGDSCQYTVSVDLRYVGQEHSVTLPVAGSVTEDEIGRLSRAFAAAHEQAYGHTMPDPVEMVALRVTAVGQAAPPELPEVPAREGQPPQSRGLRDVVVGNGAVVAYALYDRDDLMAGDTITGPAIITEHTSTTVLHAQDSADVGSYGEVIIHVGKEQ